MSARWIKQLFEIKFDKSAWQKTLQDEMTEDIKDAARSYLRTVLAIIPTWSRASRATFEALASQVGFNITFGPIRSAEDRLLLGLSTGRGGLDLKKDSWKFFYETDLRYLAFNNFNAAIFGQAPNVFSRSGIPNTPYRFTDAGEADFRSFAENFVKLPSPIEFVKPKRIV